jgi:hypothetical protein
VMGRASIVLLLVLLLVFVVWRARVEDGRR